MFFSFFGCIDLFFVEPVGDPTPPAIQDEIASLEAQMHSASTYAAAGLKRRLQTLKAAQRGDGGPLVAVGRSWRVHSIWR